MAIDQKNNYSVGDDNLTAIMASLDIAYIGKHDVSLTNFDNTSLPAMSAGSTIECDGTLYYSTSDTAIGGTPVDGVNYIQIIPGTLSATLEWTQDAPAWDDEKQGWYNTGAGDENQRYLNFIIYITDSETVYHKQPFIQPVPRSDGLIPFYSLDNGSAIVNYPIGHILTNKIVVVASITATPQDFYISVFGELSTSSGAGFTQLTGLWCVTSLINIGALLDPAYLTSIQRVF